MPRSPILAAVLAVPSLAMAQTLGPPAPTPAPVPTAATPPPPATVGAVTGAPVAPAPTIGPVAPAPTVGAVIPSALATPELSTLARALEAAELTATLGGPGPFTVFAPDNEAFGRLAPGTLDTLLKPENKETLARVLRYHVVPGKVTLAQLQQQIDAGGGTTTLTTAEGGPLTVAREGAAIVLTDPSGNKSYVARPDVEQANGVVHVVNGVVVPKLG